jgi:hypothetical protein
MSKTGIITGSGQSVSSCPCGPSAALYGQHFGMCNMSGQVVQQVTREQAWSKCQQLEMTASPISNGSL